MEITVSKEKLIKLLVAQCPFHRRGINEEDFCYADMEGCPFEVVDKIVNKCPPDCKHYYKSRVKHCKPGKCNRIKRKLKELQKL